MKKESVKKLAAAALVLGSVCGLRSSVYAATTQGWVNNKGTWYYYNENGVMQKNTEIQIKGKTYKFDNSGALINNEKGKQTAADWKLVGKDGKEYFYNKGVLQKNSIITVWGTKFKCDNNGVVVGDIVSDSNDVDKYMHQFSEDYKNNDKRWKKVNGNWHFCYLDQEKKEYSESNIVKDSWEEINKYWYHFNKNGDMDKNITIKDACGNECVLNSDGALINRNEPEYKVSESNEDDGIIFTEKNGKTYCEAPNGKKLTAWVMKKGCWYYCNKDGIVQKNTSVIVDGKKYSFDKNGVWIK